MTKPLPLPFSPQPLKASVIITGAAKRLGRALALAFAAHNWQVIGHYHHSEAEAASLSKDIKAKGGHIQTYPCDLADSQATTQFIANLPFDHDGRYVLINSASYFAYDEAGQHNPQIWQQAQAVNLYAPLILAEGFYAKLKNSQASGVIINILDNKISAPNPDYFSYSMAKFGLASAIKLLSPVLAPQIKIYGLAPGNILVSEGQTPQSFAEDTSLNPLHRPTQVQDVVEAALLLAEAGLASGSILHVDNGQRLWLLPRDVAYLDQIMKTELHKTHES